jgi:hypothetical protein
MKKTTTTTVSQHLRSDGNKSMKRGGGAYPVEFAVVLIGGEAHGEVDQPPVELHLVVERHLSMCNTTHGTTHTTHDTREKEVKRLGER